MVSPTGQSRVTSYFAGLEDPTKASYHVQRSLEAFVKGGFVGVGIGKADTKLTGLPVPPTDSIFAVVGEETGIIGAAMVIGLFVLLLWRSMVIARKAPDRFGSLLAAGLGLWMVMEAMINMSVIVGLLPFAGNALPLISAGGSSMLVSLAAIGILMNISRSGTQEQIRKDSIFNAFSNLRRRDRRRSVSRPGRTSSVD
jgi:cell division protein FtsW